MQSQGKLLRNLKYFSTLRHREAWAGSSKLCGRSGERARIPLLCIITGFHFVLTYVASHIMFSKEHCLKLQQPQDNSHKVPFFFFLDVQGCVCVFLNLSIVISDEWHVYLAPLSPALGWFCVYANLFKDTKVSCEYAFSCETFCAGFRSLCCMNTPSLIFL